MAQAKNGDKVRVHYIGTLDDGSIFDASEDKDKEFVIGQGTLIPKFEEAVVGLEPGQTAKVRIAADDAYGQRADEMVAVIQRSEIPADINPKPGDQMEVVLEDGSPMPVLVTDTSDTTITLDANHPLAGMDLNFEIRLVEIL
jgi:peptidylprolyl isomerase